MAKNYPYTPTTYGEFTRIQSALFSTLNGSNMFNNASIAQTVADQQGYAVLSLSPAPNTPNSATVYIVAPESSIQSAIGIPSTGGTGGSQGGGTGAGGGQAGKAGAAVQAGSPGFTGGGPLVKAQPVNNSIVLQVRDDSFMGVDTFTPQEKLGAGYSPDSNNWDGFSKIGSRCVRKGTAKLEDDHDSLSLNADLKGLSLALIPNDTPNQLQMMYSFADAAIGATRAAQATQLEVVLTSPRWGKTATLKGWQGPTLAATDNGGQVARCTYEYPNGVGITGKLGVRANSVVQVIVRFSPTDYPRDVDGNDYVKSTVLEDRTAWIGASDTTDTPAQTATDTIFFAAWAVTREGYSERSTASVTVA